jgi:hypothetical protein
MQLVFYSVQESWLITTENIYWYHLAKLRLKMLFLKWKILCVCKAWIEYEPYSYLYKNKKGSGILSLTSSSYSDHLIFLNLMCLWNAAMLVVVCTFLKSQSHHEIRIAQAKRQAKITLYVCESCHDHESFMDEKQIDRYYLGWYSCLEHCNL